MNSQLKSALIFLAMVSEIIGLSVGGLWVGTKLTQLWGWNQFTGLFFGLAGLVISFYRAYQWFQNLNGSNRSE